MKTKLMQKMLVTLLISVMLQFGCQTRPLPTQTNTSQNIVGSRRSFLFSIPSWSPDSSKVALTGNIGSVNAFLIVNAGLNQGKFISWYGPRVVSLSPIGMVMTTPVQLVTPAPNGTAELIQNRKLDSGEWITETKVVTTYESIPSPYNPDIPIVWLETIPDHPKGSYSRPAWSPAGDEIAVFFVPEGSPKDAYINITDPEGKKMEKVMHIPGGSKMMGLNWSADGSELLYTRTAGIEEEWICIANRDGTDERLVAKVKDLWSVSWSPDGEKIAYITRHGYKEGDLYVMNRDGSDVSNITNNGDLDTEQSLSWSPDSQRLVFLSRVHGSGIDRLYVINPNGTNKKEIMAGDFAEVSWSPDGKWLMLVGIMYQQDGFDEILIKAPADF